MVVPLRPLRPIPEAHTRLTVEWWAGESEPYYEVAVESNVVRPEDVSSFLATELLRVRDDVIRGDR